MIGTSAAKSELSESGGFLEQPLADHLLLHGMRWQAFLNWTSNITYGFIQMDFRLEMILQS